ncbi:MAG: hypothetical protein ACI8WA_000369 [Polaribacter sp.]|jgi:hypothetical protein
MIPPTSRKINPPSIGKPGGCGGGTGGGTICAYNCNENTIIAIVVTIFFVFKTHCN